MYDFGMLRRAFHDRCPHRLAPLSEGIIDPKTGQLYCNYHGCERCSRLHVLGLRLGYG